MARRTRQTLELKTILHHFARSGPAVLPSTLGWDVQHGIQALAQAFGHERRWHGLDEHLKMRHLVLRTCGDAGRPVEVWPLSARCLLCRLRQHAAKRSSLERASQVGNGLAALCLHRSSRSSRSCWSAKLLVKSR